MVAITLLVLVLLAVLGLLGWRQRDHWADREEMDRLRALQPAKPARFARDMIFHLPEPARRYLFFSIGEGTPLYSVAEIDMEGQFSLGTKDAPSYMKMRATQVLAAPEGFVWKMEGGSGLMRVSGSDTGRWTRFWVAGLIPVARVSGEPDHARSAFGRHVAEAVFWTPAALLPGPGVQWEATGKDEARVTLSHGGFVQSVDIAVAEDGRPTQVAFARWTNANSDKAYRIQPFGGYLSEFRDVMGFRLPTHVEAGNHFGTGDYFPFFIADVMEVRIPKPGANF